MKKSEWRVASLAEIPSIHERSSWEGYATDADFGKGWHSVRHHLGLDAFGINANEAEAGEELIAEHDERQDGDQEELYFIFRGRAAFILDREEAIIEEGDLLAVGGHVTRSARALASPTIVLAIGAIPDRRYQPPDWDQPSDAG